VSLFDDPTSEAGKTCSTCRTWKPLDSFNRRATARDGRQWACRECNREYHRHNKKRHNALIHRRKRRVIADNLRKIHEFLSAHACVDCGESDPVVLEFDHLRDKRTEVSRLVRGWEWRTVAAEIEKCEVVCANCHRRRTFQRAGSWRIVGVREPIDRPLPPKRKKPN
jgi:hypothetical protein